MKSENRKLVLLLDNCSSHNVNEVSNVRNVKFPPNMTSHVQPLDAGIIDSYDATTIAS